MSMIFRTHVLEFYSKHIIEKTRSPIENSLEERVPNCLTLQTIYQILTSLLFFLLMLGKFA